MSWESRGQAPYWCLEREEEKVGQGVFSEVMNGLYLHR